MLQKPKRRAPKMQPRSCPVDGRGEEAGGWWLKGHTAVLGEILFLGLISLEGLLL
jgi:hypothetical protein